MGRYCEVKVNIGTWLKNERLGVKVVKARHKIAPGGNCRYDLFSADVPLSSSMSYALAWSSMVEKLKDLGVTDCEPELNVTVELHRRAKVFTNMIALLPPRTKVPSVDEGWSVEYLDDYGIHLIGPPIDAHDEYNCVLWLDEPIVTRWVVGCLNEVRRACEAIGKGAEMHVVVKLEGP